MHAHEPGVEPPPAGRRHRSGARRRAPVRARRRVVAAGAVAVALLAGGMAAVDAIGRNPLRDLGRDRDQAGPGGHAAVLAGQAVATTLPPAGKAVNDLPKPPPTTKAPASSRPREPAPGRRGGRPGPGNTGVPAGVTLQARGDLTISRDGAVVDRLDINGCLTIAASDVTVRRSRIRCDGDYVVRIADGARRAVLEDVEIDGTGSPGPIAIGIDDFTLRRADVHGVGDGPRMGDNTVVEDSWIHDLARGDGAHNDGIQSTGGRHIRILRNRIEHPHEQTSCILLGADLGDISDALVQGNYLNGGNYTVYAGSSDGYRADGIRIVGNRFGRDMVYGTHSLNDRDDIVFSGNVWDDTGRPVQR